VYSIYLITNKVNGKIYVGYTKGTPEWRFSLHVRDARNRKDANYHLANAIKKYGAEAFSVAVIAIAGCERSAKAEETRQILARMSHDRTIGYNMTTGGEGGLTEEARKKISIANTGKVRTEATRRRMSHARSGSGSWTWGKPRTEEHKAKMSKLLKGRFMGSESSTWKDIPVEEAAAMYASGLSSRAIGGVFGVSGHTIIARLKSVGIVRRPRWCAAAKNLSKARRGL
jgi:group I intron endonuclease